MSEIGKLKKINDELYVQDYVYEGKSGTSEWKRQPEALNLRLEQVTCVCSASTTVREFSLFGHDDDVVNDDSRIVATGILERDSLQLINGKGEKVFRRVSSVTIKPAEGDWSGQINSERAEGKLNLSSGRFGILWFYEKDEAEKNPIGIGDGDEFFLELLIPHNQFWSVFQWLCTHTQTASNLSLVARIAAFRSDADRGLEDWNDPRRYFVEKTSAACVSHFSLTLSPSFIHSERTTESATKSIFSIPINNLTGDSPSSTSRWLKLMFFAIVVLVLVELFKG